MTRRRDRYENSAPLVGTRPRRQTLVEQQVTVPLALGAILGLALAIPLGILAGLLARELSWPWWVGPAVGAGVWCMILAWRTWAADADRRRLLLWEIEEATGQDLDGDHWVGEPQTRLQAARDQREPRLVYVRDPARQRRRRQAEDFRFFLREAYGDRGTTWRAWDGATLPSGDRMTRTTWESYCERLERAGLATRPYPTAALVVDGSTYREALRVFRELW